MRSKWFRSIGPLAAALLLSACGPSPPPPNSADAASDPAVAPPAEDDGGEQAESPAKSTQDAPEISRSAGKEGGVVVFWPRVVPRTEDPQIRKLAGDLQKRLVDLVAKAVPERERDVRPEPERVCPKSGCDAMTVGALLTASGGGCVALALVAPPGPSPQRIIPWAGDVELKYEQVPFREPPESSVTIKDMASCAKLVDKLEERAPDVVKAIQQAAP
jgi:hypothetical protein